MRISDWSSDVCSSDLKRCLASAVWAQQGEYLAPMDVQVDVFQCLKARLVNLVQLGYGDDGGHDDFQMSLRHNTISINTDFGIFCLLAYVPKGIHSHKLYRKHVCIDSGHIDAC